MQAPQIVTILIARIVRYLILLNIQIGHASLIPYSVIQATTNTCGPCLVGYNGERGDANSHCVSSTELSTLARPMTSVNVSCNTNDDCTPWESCSDASKKCVSKVHFVHMLYCLIRYMLKSNIQMEFLLAKRMCKRLLRKWGVCLLQCLRRGKSFELHSRRI